MAGGKESPRQKMIGMMYLVLTAMLALNVSRQVLNAFAVVNEGLKQTNKNYDEKNQSNYEDFDNAMKKDPARTKKYYDNAMKAKAYSKTMCEYIDTLKSILISTTDDKPRKVADTIKLMNVDAKENFDIPTRLMIGEDESKGRAHLLRVKLDEYRKNMLALLDKPGDSSSINLGLLAKGGFNADHLLQGWEVFNFEEQPLASAVVTLTRIQNEVKNAEASVVQKLLSSITRNTMVVDKFDPVVYQPQSYVLQGDSFKANIFLAASQKTQDPRIFIDSVNGHAVSPMKVPIKNGEGVYALKSTEVGEQKFAGRIGVQDPEDVTGQKYIFYKFRSSYLSAKPSSIVSPSKMNVFYIGVDNPLDVSAAGFSDENLTPSINIGSIAKATGGGYVVRIPPGTKPTPPNAPPSCNIEVSGKTSDGQRKNLGSHPFRIKRVPDPYCYFASKKGDMYLSKGELSAYSEVSAKLESFDFDLPFSVTSFQMAVTVNGLSEELSSNNNKITEEMRKVLNHVTKGTHIIIENVKVRSIAGATTIPGVNITVD